MYKFLLRSTQTSCLIWRKKNQSRLVHYMVSFILVSLSDPVHKCTPSIAVTKIALARLRWQQEEVLVSRTRPIRRRSSSGLCTASAPTALDLPYESAQRPDPPALAASCPRDPLRDPAQEEPNCHYPSSVASHWSNEMPLTLSILSQPRVAIGWLGSMDVMSTLSLNSGSYLMS